MAAPDKIFNIYLSPSDQGKNVYAAGNTNEEVQCERIAIALEKALLRCRRFRVINALTGSMQERVAESNEFKADLHVPLHTNAFDANVSGTRIFCFDMNGVGYKAAKAIFDRLAPITPGTSENIKAAPHLYEVRASAAPCVYIETDFHDVDSVATWIIANTAPIAEAICQGICDYFGVPYVVGEVSPSSARYQRMEDLPDWAIPEATELVSLGALKGNEKGLDLTEDMLRGMIINLRTTKALLYAS